MIPQDKVDRFKKDEACDDRDESGHIYGLIMECNVHYPAVIAEEQVICYGKDTGKGKKQMDGVLSAFEKEIEKVKPDKKKTGSIYKRISQCIPQGLST